MFRKAFDLVFGGSYAKLALALAAVALVLSAYAYHRYAVSKAYDDGFDNATEACALATEKAKNAILDRFATQQSFVIAQLGVDNDALQLAVDTITAALPARITVYRSTANAKPLAADCRADADRLRSINAGRQRLQPRADPAPVR